MCACADWMINTATATIIDNFMLKNISEQQQDEVSKFNVFIVNIVFDRFHLVAITTIASISLYSSFY